MTRRIRDPMSALALVAALAAAGCGWGTPADSDSLAPGPPILISVTPAGGSRDVSTATSIGLRWSDPIAPGMEHLVALHLRDLGGLPLPLSCLWSADRTRLRCSPMAPLTASTLYTIHVGGGILGENGQPADMSRYGMSLGGQWVVGGMTTGVHAGSPWGTTSDGSPLASGSLGMAFVFTTAG